MSFQFLQVSQEDGVLVVLMNRPPVNAVHQPFYREMRDCFRQVADRQDVNVVLFGSAVKHFCAGNDVSEFTESSPDQGPRPVVQESFEALHDCAVPVVAAVHGAALGTGLGLAAMCDVIVCSEDAYFRLPEIDVGVLGGGPFLKRMVPEHKLRKMYLTGDSLTAREGLALGCVEAVVPRDQLMTAAMDLAKRIGSKSPVSLRFAKQALNELEFLPLKDAFAIEQRLSTKLSGYEDSKEAARAFLERRPPQFKGR